MATRTPVTVWIGRGMSLLISALFLFSAMGKLSGAQQVKEGFAHLGLPETLITPLGILELLCTLVYLFPPTATLGAILLTGYLGGAICMHLRLSEPVYMHILFGIVFWLALVLRDSRLWSLLPWRTGLRDRTTS